MTDALSALFFIEIELGVIAACLVVLTGIIGYTLWKD